MAVNWYPIIKGNCTKCAKCIEFCPVNNMDVLNNQLIIKDGFQCPDKCNMCKEKIPKDKSARYATDPHSLKKISKADAYIVVIGNNNEVAYFENEGNYQQFLKENS